MQCPLCKKKRFYLKDPEDPYETYAFSSDSGGISFDSGLDAPAVPELSEETRIYCNHCSWNGRFREIQTG